MPPDQVVRIITAVADALDYAHSKNLTHRDVKPANILMADPGTEHERIMLADFGIARQGDDTSNLTGTDMTVGTVAYAAPEQLRGEDIDGHADQYALAATAYQLLTGTPPFHHSNPAVVISQHLTADPPPIGDRRPELSSLGPAFDKALAKSPHERYDRCIDFARALAHRIGTSDADGGDQTILAHAATGPRHSRGHANSQRYVIPAVILLAVAVAAVAFVVIDRARGHRPEAQPRPTSVSSPTTTAPTVDLLPLAIVGSKCAPLGAAGVTKAGVPTYCAHLPSTNASIWSLYPGEINTPTVTAGPNDEVYPSETEQPVLVCMEQTGQSRLDCHDAVLQGNATATATPSS
jgi:serine/threonine-protein kinase